MGYEICCYEGEFKILPPQVPGAYKALMKLLTDNSKLEFYRPLIFQATTLKEIFEYVGFEVKCDDFGGIAGLTYSWGKGYDMAEKVLEVVSPYVLSGSYLIWKGEEDEHWRKAFYNGVMFNDDGEVIFPLFPWDKAKPCTCEKKNESR